MFCNKRLCFAVAFFPCWLFASCGGSVVKVCGIKRLCTHVQLGAVISEDEYNDWQRIHNHHLATTHRIKAEVGKERRELEFNTGDGRRMICLSMQCMRFGLSFVSWRWPQATQQLRRLTKTLLSPQRDSTITYLKMPHYDDDYQYDK